MSTNPPASPNEPSLRPHVVVADLRDPGHQQAIVQLLDQYARHPMGRGRPLEPQVTTRLAHGLANHPTTHIWLARRGDQPVGILVAFVGYSTFEARPLLNVHDVFVCPLYRGQGIGRLLLEAAEQGARQLNCCKLTLEVRDDNLAAQALYRHSGFDPGVRGVDAMSWWTKDLQ